MTALQIMPPPIEPVTLEEAKSFLRIDHSDDDQRIQALIEAARSYVETKTGRVLIEQGWRIYRDCWPRAGVVRLRPAPVVRVDAVTVFDADGVPRILSPDEYKVDTASAPGRLRLQTTAALYGGNDLNGIEIDVTAGYGTSAAEVPAPVRQAILVLVADWYEHRDAASFGVATPAAAGGLSGLLAPYRLVRVA